MYVCVYVYVYVCIYIYIYIHICIYKATHHGRTQSSAVQRGVSLPDHVSPWHVLSCRMIISSVCYDCHNDDDYEYEYEYEYE